MANPDRSFYGFGYDPDRKKAGQFVLAFRAGINAEIQYWVSRCLERFEPSELTFHLPSQPIKVVPGAFVLLNDEHGGITELVSTSLVVLPRDNSDALLRQCNAFKTAYIARTSLNPAMLPSGRTPAYAGGRTPAYPGGGRTPMPGGGRTPAPNPNRMPTPNPYRAGGGVTPRPPSGMTPRPPSGTTPRPAGGMTPAYGAEFVSSSPDFPSPCADRALSFAALEHKAGRCRPTTLDTVKVLHHRSKEDGSSNSRGVSRSLKQDTALARERTVNTEVVNDNVSSTLQNGRYVPSTRDYRIDERSLRSLSPGSAESLRKTNTADCLCSYSSYFLQMTVPLNIYQHIALHQSTRSTIHTPARNRGPTVDAD